MPNRKERTKRKTIDSDTPSVVSGEQEAELKTSPEVKDKNINYSDIPPIDETKHWYKAAEHPAVYRPLKKPTTIRLDADVLEWLKSKGKGYQTRINQILRDAMLDEIQR